MAGKSRTLFVGGTLGFHGPYFPFSANMDESMIETVYASAIDDIGELVAAASELEFDNSLIAQMLYKGKDEYFYIDTIDKAGLWKIHIAGLPKLSISRRELAYACFNSFAWSSGVLTDDIVDQVEGVSTMFNFPENVSIENIVDFWLKDNEIVVDTNDKKLTATMGVRYLGEGVLEECKLELLSRDEMGLYYSECSTNFSEVTSRTNQMIDCGGDGANINSIFPNNIRDNTFYEHFFSPGLKLNSKAVEEYARAIESNADSTGVVAKLADAPIIDSSDRAAFDFYENRDARGDDVAVVRELTEDTCFSECFRNDKCVAFTFDRWNRVCVLKSNVDNLRLDPRAKSGVLQGLAAPPEEDTRSPVIQKRRSKSFPNIPFVDFLADSYEVCAERCLADAKCIGFNFKDARSECAIMDSLSEYEDSEETDIGIKMQTP